MKQDNNVVRILIVEKAVEDAEQIISILRNSGVAVRPARASDEQEFTEAMESLGPDLVLANPETGGLEFSEISRAIEASGKDIALIALVSSTREKLISRVFADGARAVAMRKNASQLQTIVSREFDALSMRRGVRRLEAALRESERRCDALLESSRDPIAYVHEGMHVRANKAYLEMFGYETFDDVEGLSLLDMVAAEDAEDFKTLLKRISHDEKPPPKLEIKAQRADGSTFDAVLEFTRATFEGESCLQINFHRQELNPDLARQLDELRWHDPVSGLFNRAHLLEHLDHAVAEAAEGRSDQALLLIEPDNYRNLLESVGLANADSLLHALASAISQSLADSDVAGRLSDHTFGVLLSRSPQEAIDQLAEQIRHGVEERILEAGNRSVSLTVSIGGALLGEKNANTQTLLQQASERLQSVHEEGGNRVDIHNPAAKEQAEAAREHQWLEMLRSSLENDDFVLYYQQIISLQGSEGEYYEILLRMRGPKGEIPPNHFLPVAERNDLLPAIDRWVIAKAIEVLGERAREKNKTTFFVKLTQASLVDEGLADWIGERIREAGIDGEQLVFEMPESKVVTSLKPAGQFVENIKKLGCAFALEQFGSGLNSFQLLNHVPADYLKVDRTFLNELPKNPDNQRRVREICTQAADIDKLTVAEWVEDAASASILFSCGVHFMQGNFLQEPEKIIAFETT